METLKRVLDSVDTLDAFTRSPMYAHMQFNSMEHGVEERLKEKLKETFRGDERFAFVRESSEWEEMLK